MALQPSPRLIHSHAPIRVCDNGGWTDTWFAGHGAVCNIAVSPGATVQIAATPRAPRTPHVTLHVINYDQRIHYEPAAWGARPPFDHPHPLLAAALAEIAPPDDLALDIEIASPIPAGASTGTSAAVTVALLGALDALRPGRRTAHEIAYAAHRVETVRLGQQSGIQDQLASAYGGVSYIEMMRYPHASVSPIRLAPALRWELERRLLLVFLGTAHSSSEVHGSVIARLEQEGGASPQLAGLRHCAALMRDALYAGDWPALGRAMDANTEFQRALHPELISPGAQALIELARAHGALGWKVNGAGGAGGTVALLCGPDNAARRALLERIPQLDSSMRVIPIALDADGLRVWEST